MKIVPASNSAFLYGFKVGEALSRCGCSLLFSLSFLSNLGDEAYVFCVIRRSLA